ncbi:SbcC/MukB-like Walker B domain-containing protein [Enterococcus cecorum]
MDFNLYQSSVDGRIYLSRLQLKNLIVDGKHGKLFDDAKSYQRYINDRIFGFQSMEQYNDLIQLLIRLRAPKLSRDFKPSVIYEILQSSLPVLDSDTLLPLTQTIQNIDDNHDQLDTLLDETKQLSRFLRYYQQYQEELTAQIAENWLEKDAIVQDISAKLTQLKQSIDSLNQELSQKENQLKELKIRQPVLENTVSELKNHEGFQLIQRAKDLQDSFNKVRKRLEEIENQLHQKLEKKQETSKKIDELQTTMYQTEKELNDYLESASQYIEDLSLEYIHQNICAKLFEKLTREDEQYLMKEVTKKEQFIQKIIQQMRNLSKLAIEEKEKSNELAELQKILDELKRDQSQWQQGFVDEVQKWKEQINAWRAKSPVMIADEVIQQVYYQLDQIQVTDEFVSEVFLLPLKTVFEQANEQILHHIQSTNVIIEQKESKLRGLQVEIETWKNERDPIPARSLIRQENRNHLNESQKQYAFFELIDFKSDITDEQKNILEGTLYSSGLLDALVAKEKLDLADDIQIVANPQLLCSTLADYCEVAADTPGELVELVAEFLQTILVDEGKEGCPSIYLDGHFELAGIYGKMVPNYQASFIGKLSRERYRQQKIAELTEEVNQLAKEISLLQQQLETYRLEQSRQREYLSLIPDTEQIREAMKQYRSVSEKINVRIEEIQRKNQIYLALKQKIADVNREIMLQTQKERITPKLESYEEALVFLKNYQADMQASFRQYDQLYVQKKHEKELSQQLADIHQDIAIIEQSNQQYLQEENTLQQQITENTAQQELQNISEIKQRINEKEEELTEVKDKIEETRNQKEQLNMQLALEKSQYLLQQENYEKNAPVNILWKKLIQTHLQIEDTERLQREAQKIARPKDFDLLFKNERKLEDEFRYLADNVREYQPKMSREVDVSTDLTQEDDSIQTFKNYSQRLIATFRLDQQSLGPNELLSFLENQIAIVKNTLKADDEKLFKQIIFDSVGKVLRALIERAFIWVEEIDQLLKSRKNSQGLKLSLRLKNIGAQNEHELGTKDLIALLRKDPITLNESDSRLLVEHFQSKIQDAKELIADESTEGNLSSAIAEVLDYRKWFTFELQFRRANENYPWRPLSDNQFNIFSGGEKAISMYLPLFAVPYMLGTKRLVITLRILLRWMKHLLVWMS